MLSACFCQCCWSLESGPLSLVVSLAPRPPPFALGFGWEQALVDGPLALTGVSRTVVNFKRLSLTDHKVKIGVNAGHKALVAAWTKGDVLNKWNTSAWGLRLKKRAEKPLASDFDRFSAMVAKKKVRLGLGAVRGA
jgi:ribosomal protein L14E/L6E/L27E